MAFWFLKSTALLFTHRRIQNPHPVLLFAEPIVRLIQLPICVWPLINGWPVRLTSTRFGKKSSRGWGCWVLSWTGGAAFPSGMVHCCTGSSFVPCPVWKLAAWSHVRKLQVLQSNRLRTATGAPWYITNRQIHEDLGVPFFADHIRALTESFNSKLADAGNSLVRQLGRYLCWPRINLTHLKRKPSVLMVTVCRGSYGRPINKKNHAQLALFCYPDWGFSVILPQL